MLAKNTNKLMNNMPQTNYNNAEDERHIVGGVAKNAPPTVIAAVFIFSPAGFFEKAF